MTGRIIDMHARPHPTAVKVIVGAPAVLVTRRSQYGEKSRYSTNREIKYWSTWFLLKSLTTTSVIKNWTAQKAFILEYLHLNENTLRAHLSWLKQEKLITIDRGSRQITMISYKKAAELLDLTFNGVYTVSYNHLDKKLVDEKQPFQYLLRMEECEHHKQRQAEAVAYKLDNNPLYKEDMYYQLIQIGADGIRLRRDPEYFRERLLVLQKLFFLRGSEILSYVMTVRADINRGVRKIKAHHGYRSAQSVSYFKRRMAQMGLARIRKDFVISEARSRLYVPAEGDTPPQKVRGGVRDGYVYNRLTKATVWILCDQIARAYKIEEKQPTSKSARYAA